MDGIQFEENNIWHYTTLNGLMGVLESQRLWASDYRHLNDCTELSYARSVLQDQLSQSVIHLVSQQYNQNSVAKSIIDNGGGVDRFAAEETRDTIDILCKGLTEGKSLSTIPCILSFCLCAINNKNIQSGGLLSQWRGYGPDGGYAIVFNLSEMLKYFMKECELFRYAISDYGDVCYEYDNLNKEHDLYAHLDRIIDFASNFYRYRIGSIAKPEVTGEVVGSLAHCLTRFKHIGFEEEKEFRFFVFPFEDEIALNKIEPPVKNGKLFKKIHSRKRLGTSVPYVELFEETLRLPIQRIIVGPHKEKDKRAASLRIYLKSQGIYDIKVDCSDIPYINQCI